MMKRVTAPLLHLAISFTLQMRHDGATMQWWWAGVRPLPYYMRYSSGVPWLYIYQSIKQVYEIGLLLPNCWGNVADPEHAQIS